MEATSIDGLVAHCQSGRFTGILRMRAREGMGEIWFLSGLTDEIHFGVSTADEAMDRMRKATEATYELAPRLPDPAGGFKRRFPTKGSIATATPVTLMRYCERYALTCTLAVESGDVLVEATYELGELVSVETTADDDGITAMLEAREGTYEFTLPRVELPAGTPVLPPAPSLMESMPPPPESLGFRALLEAKPPAGRPASDEAELKRKTVEIARQQKSPTAKSVPRPIARVEKKAEAKPVAAPPAPEPKPAVESVPAKIAPPVAVPAKEEPKPAKARAPAKVAPPVAVPAKEEAKPAVESASAKIAPPVAAPAKEEAKTAEASAPAPAEPTKPPDESASDEPAERESESGPDESESDESEPAEPRPIAPAKRSLTWLVVPLLLAVAVGYLFWTHRI